LLREFHAITGTLSGSEQQLGAFYLVMDIFQLTY
jgi:hypothetical protein